MPRFGTTARHRAGYLYFISQPRCDCGAAYLVLGFDTGRADRQEENMRAYWFAGFTGIMLWCQTASGAEVYAAKDAYGEVRHTAVRAGDLDLTRKDGAEELLQRLAFAAVRVCDAETSNRDLKMHKFHRACMKDTMDRAVASVPSPLLKRLYADSQGE